MGLEQVKNHAKLINKKGATKKISDGLDKIIEVLSVNNKISGEIKPKNKKIKKASKI